VKDERLWKRANSGGSATRSGRCGLHVDGWLNILMTFFEHIDGLFIVFNLINHTLHPFQYESTSTYENIVHVV